MHREFALVLTLKCSEPYVGYCFRFRLISSSGEGTEGLSCTSPSGGNKFWESLPHHVF